MMFVFRFQDRRGAVIFCVHISVVSTFMIAAGAVIAHVPTWTLLIEARAETVSSYFAHVVVASFIL